MHTLNVSTTVCLIPRPPTVWLEPGWHGNKAKYTMALCSLIPRLIVSSCVSLGLRLVSMWPFTYPSSSSSGLHFLLTALLLWTWHLGGRRSTSHTHGHCNQLRNTEMNFFPNLQLSLGSYTAHVTHRMLASFPDWLQGGNLHHTRLLLSKNKVISWSDKHVKLYLITIVFSSRQQVTIFWSSCLFVNLM